MSFESLVQNIRKYRPDTSYEEYYEQESRLDALGISLPETARVLEVQAPFAKMSVDILTEVVRPSGWRSEEVDSSVLRRMWRRCNMDTSFQLALTEMLVSGVAYWLISPEADGGVSVRTIDADHATVRLAHDGTPLEGVIVYKLGEDNAATYYTPEGAQFWREVHGMWRVVGERPDGVMNLLPMVNRSRIADTYGRSELAELAPVIDAASRTLTNLQVLQEVSSAPLRVLIGDGSSDALAEFPDAMAATLGKILAAPAGSDIKQVNGASLDPFLNAFKTYALQISAMTGIPPSMMGVSADSNPTSAEALRTAKDRLIARAEAKQRLCGPVLEEIGETMLRYSGTDVESGTLETAWLDAAAPSESAQVANILQSAAQGIVSAETARDFLNLSPEQLEREAANDGNGIGETVSAQDLLSLVTEEGNEEAA